MEMVWSKWSLDAEFNLVPMVLSCLALPGVCWAEVTSGEGSGRGQSCPAPACGPAPGARVFARAMPQLCWAQAGLQPARLGGKSQCCSSLIPDTPGLVPLFRCTRYEPEQNKWELGWSQSSQNLSWWSKFLQSAQSKWSSFSFIIYEYVPRNKHRTCVLEAIV